MKIDRSVINYLENFFVPRKGDTTLKGNVWPAETEAHNLGLPTLRWDTVYARQVVADSISGVGSSDMVDGFHAYSTPQPSSLLALDANSVFPTSVYPSALLLDGTRSLTGNLSVDAGVTIDGVDISVHKAGTAREEHIAGLGTSLSVNATLASSGSLESGSQSLAVNDAHPFTWTAQHVFDAGLRLNDGDRLNFGSASDQYLYRYNASDIGIHGGLRSISPDWQSELIGWHISYDGNADFRRIFADELHVRAFIADIEQALAGGQIISKSVAILAQDFTVPQTTAYIYVEDLPGFYGVQAFQSGDYVRLRRIDRSGGGLVVEDIWGSVTGYVDQGGGVQRWTFTRAQGSYGATVIIHKGAVVIDYGTTGQGYWEVTTIDTQYSPYAQVVTWATNPWTPANRTVRTRMGKLDGLTDPDMTPGGWGLYSDNAYLNGELIAVNGEVKILADGIVINPGSVSGPSNEHKIRWEGSDPNEQAWVGFGETLASDFWAYLYAIANNPSHKAHVDIGAFTGNYDMQLVLDADDSSDFARARFVFNSTAELFRIADTGITFYRDILPNAHNTWDIGSDTVRVANLYVENLHATNQEIGGDLTGQAWTYPGDMYIKPESAAAHTVVYVQNPDAAYQANLSVEGNILVGGTVDGVDLSGFKSMYDTHAGNANAHHYRSHSITSASDHTVSGSALDLVGLTAANTLGIVTPSSSPGVNERILKSTAAGELTLQGLAVSGNITITGTIDGVDVGDFKSAYDTHIANANAHHNQVHAVTGPDHTITASAFQLVGATATDTLGLVTPSSDPGAAEAVLKTDALGVLTLAGLMATNLTATTLYVGVSGSYFSASSTEVIVNDSGDPNLDFRVEGGAGPNLLFVDAGNSRVGVGLDAPAARLHVLAGTEPQFRLGYDTDNYADFSISSGGTMTIAVVGDLVLDPQDNDVLPANAYDVNLGALDKKYLALHAAELWVETLVAQDTSATIGGRILVGPTTSLTFDFLAGVYVLPVKHNQIARNDILYMEAGGKVEFIKPQGVAMIGVSQVEKWFRFAGDFSSKLTNGVQFKIVESSGFDITWTCSGNSVYDPSNNWTTVYVSETVKGETPSGYMLYYVSTGAVTTYNYWNTARNLDGTGENDWYAGDAVFNTGQPGSGFIDLYSIRGVKSGTQYGPAIVGNVRNSTTFNDWTEHWAIGNLNGLYGMTSNAYGVGLGKYGADHILITAANGIQFKNSSGTVMGSLSSSTWRLGSVSDRHIDIVAGAVYIREAGADGARTLIANNNGLWVGNYDAGDYVKVDTVGVRIFANDAERGRFDVGGSFWIGSSYNTQRLAWDSTNGLQMYAPGNYSVFQADISGNVRFGRLGSGYGNMLWNASNYRLEFRGNTDVKAYVDTDGSISAGGGKVKLTTNGITISDSVSGSGYLLFGSSPYKGRISGHTSGTNGYALELFSYNNLFNPNDRATYLLIDTDTYALRLRRASSGGQLGDLMWVEFGGGLTVQSYILSGYYIQSNTEFRVGSGGDILLQPGTNGSLKVQTSSGYTLIGPQNASWSHFYTDRQAFYFDKPVAVNGDIYKYQHAWSSYAYSRSGWSSVSSSYYYYKKIGKMVFIQFYITGTSNSATHYITLPSNAVTSLDFHNVFQVNNNGSYIAGVGAVGGSYPNRLYFYTLSGGTLSSTGTVGVYGQMFYEEQ